MPITPPSDRPSAPSFPDQQILEMLESYREPAILYLPGGRIAAVNAAARRLAEYPVIGMTLDELLDRHPARRADGGQIRRCDLPFARALRGEVVALGERIEITLPDGTPYPALVTSLPVVRNGTVVGALSVWHDFSAYAKRLALQGEPPEHPPSAD